MKRSILFGLLLASSAATPLLSSSLCSGTLADLEEGGVCDFGVYSVDVLSFRAIATTPNPLTADQIILSASATTGNSGVDISFSVVDDGEFIANNAAAGTGVLAGYLIDYTVTGPAAFTSETLAVVGGSATPFLAGYLAFESADKQPVGIASPFAQSKTVSLSGSPVTLDVSDAIILAAVTNKNGSAGTSKFSSLDNQFANVVAIPEPVSLLSCGAGLFALGLLGLPARIKRGDPGRGKRRRMLFRTASTPVGETSARAGSSRA
jgi:hypothetical protein